MKKMLCTTYNNTKKGLVLRQNWIEPYSEENLKKWGIEPFDVEPEKGISHIVEGVMDLPNVVIHIRVVKY